MSDLTALTLVAMERMFSVGGATFSFTVDGSAPMRSLASECTSIINAMRGKLDNKKRWQVAIVKSEVPVGKTVAPGRTATVAGITGKIEEADFVDDSGVLSFYVS